MPRQGYKSITVREEVYQYFWEEWQKNKLELNLKSIMSFSAFCTYLLNKIIEQEKKRNQK
jgi:hypothetical protein